MAAHESNDGDGKEQTDSLAPRFECPICLTYLKEPYLTSCGHKFCKKCIHEWFNKHGSFCPMDCRALKTETDLFPDNYTRRELSQVKLKCSAPECSDFVPLPEYEKHLQAHERVDPTSERESNGVQEYPTGFKCGFSKMGCKQVFSSGTQAAVHMETDTQHHLKLLASSLELLSTKIPIQTKSEEASTWDPPPKQSSTADQNLLIKSLYERIVILEQKNVEKDFELKKLEEKCEAVTREKLRFENELPLRFSNGTYVWTVADMRSKVRNLYALGLNEENNVLLYTQGFYTSYYGYKFCAKMQLLSHDKFLPLHIHLMKGENDFSLSWPFSGRIVFTLIHPMEPSQSLREVMCSRPDIEAFKRPVKPMNTRGFGYSEFISIADLKSKGFYFEDGSIVIKIEVNTV